MPGLASLSKSLVSRLGERRSQVCLLELDGKDKVTGDYIAFQYFPETITDTKQINYQPKDIPGGSLPLYQWTSSGERLITFEAVFTADVDLATDKNAFGQLISKGHARRNVDIRTALLWLRRYTLPRYEDDQQVGVPLTLAPRKCILYIPNSGLGMLGGAQGVTVPPGDVFGTATAVDSGNKLMVTGDRVLSIMTQCDITYEAFFPSGLPRIVTVQLSFAQIAQFRGEVNFPRDADILQKLVDGSQDSTGVYPYKVRAKFK